MGMNCSNAAYSRDKSAAQFGLAVEGRCLTMGAESPRALKSHRITSKDLVSAAAIAATGLDRVLH